MPAGVGVGGGAAVTPAPRAPPAAAASGPGTGAAPRLQPAAASNANDTIATSRNLRATITASYGSVLSGNIGGAMKGGVVVAMVLAVVAIPLFPAAASAPKLPRGFAGERFARVTVMRGIPTGDWREAQGYMHWKTMIEDGPPPVRPAGVCVWHPPDDHRIFALAGLGQKYDFLVYRHRPEQSNDPEHDHLLVFNHGSSTLAFSCVGKLPRRASAVSTAVAAGRCTRETGPYESR
jgi:hypothetical protein